MKKKTWYRIVCIFFAILTIAGIIYVSMNDWTVNAGYVCVPLVFSLVFLLLATGDETDE